LFDKHFPQGNLELLKLLGTCPFDRERAEALIKQLPDINDPIEDENGYSKTYLCEAVNSLNYDAVDLLLEYGANPNYNNSDVMDDCPLIELCGYRGKDNVPIQYRIAKLLLQRGADPNFFLEDETVFDFVQYEFFEQDNYGGNPFINDYMKLLIAYGGGYPYNSLPKIYKPIDKERIDDYIVQIIRDDRGFFKEAYLLSPNGEIAALLYS
jgi:hypothetical protein